MKTKTRLAALLPLLAALATLTLATACQQTARLDTRTFALKHLSPTTAEQLIAPYVYQNRPGMPGKWSTTQGAITVRETPDNLDKIQRVLEQFDVPRPDVRLHFQLIEADGFTNTDPAIAPVEAQLKKIFQFKGYRLVGETYVAATDRSSIGQSIAGDGAYEVRGNILWDQPETIRLQDVQLLSYNKRVLYTTVNIRPGQTLVLGSAAKVMLKSGPPVTLLLTVRAETAPQAGDTAK